MDKLVEKEFVEPATRYIGRLLEKVPRSYRVDALKWLVCETKDMITKAKDDDERHAETIAQAARKAKGGKDLTELFGLLEEAVGCENSVAAKDISAEIIGQDGELVDCLLDKERKRYNSIVRGNRQFLFALGIKPVRK